MSLIDQFRRYAFPTYLTAAARNSRIAWASSEQGRNNVLVAAAPQFKARRLTDYGADDGQEISSVQLTPDGDWVVFVRGGDHGANWSRDLPANPRSLPERAGVEIWSAPFAGGAPQRIAAGDAPCLCPNGRQLVFANGDTVWRAPIDGLAEASQLFSTRGRVESLAWSPDGERLAFVANRHTHSFVGIYSGANSPIQWVAPSISRDTQPRWSADGRRLAFVRLASDRALSYPGPRRFWDVQQLYLRAYEPKLWSIWVADIETGEARKWWSSGRSLKDSAVDWWPYMDWAAGERIVFMSYQDGWRHLYTLAAPEGEPELLTPGAYSIDDVTQTVDRLYLVFSANGGADTDDIDRRHLFTVPVDRAEVSALTSGAGLEWAPVIVDTERVALISASAQRPPQTAIARLDRGSLQLITLPQSAAPYPINRLVVPRKVTFKAKDGTTVHGQLFVSNALNATPRSNPAVLYIHGGPGPQQLLGWHPMDYYSNDYCLNQALAERGFVVLAVNFRTDFSYGHEYQFAAASGPHGAADYQDIQAAGLYLQSLPQVDPARVGVYGGSYGGYMTALALAHDSNLFKVGVDIHGVHDWIDQYSLRTILEQRAYDRGDVQTMLDTAWRSSPASAVSTWRSPVLFISGDDDRNVSFDQTLDLIRRLEERGVYYEALTLPDETHSLLLYSNILKISAATMEFLERFLIHKGSDSRG